VLHDFLDSFSEFSVITVQTLHANKCHNPSLTCICK